MTRPLSFFVGSASAANVQRLVANLDWMLTNGREAHLITTRPAAFRDGTSTFEIYGDDFAESGRGEYRALTDYLRGHDPAAVVQLTYPPVHGSLVGIATKRYQVPFVYRYNGDRFKEYAVARGRDKFVSFAIGNVLGRVPIRLSDHNVVLGPHGKSRLQEYGVEPDTITVLPPSIDVDAFRPATTEPVFASIPEERKIALFVGRLSHLKGVETLERAIPAVVERRPDVHFVLVGDGKSHLSIPERYRDNVTYEGRVPPEAMPSYYAQADVLVHPSLTEGVPRALLESLAAGTPVLARNVGDVASVTANTFTTTSALVEGITSLESLEVDSIDPYSRETLRPRYLNFFDDFH